VRGTSACRLRVGIERIAALRCRSNENKDAATAARTCRVDLAASSTFIHSCRALTEMLDRVTTDLSTPAAAAAA